MEKLHSLSYLDDEKFARNWASSRSTRGYGQKRIEQELRSKGIAEGLIREILRETMDSEWETNNARALLAKKFAGHSLTDPREVRRAVAFLQRRGYSSDVIFTLLRHPLRDD